MNTICPFCDSTNTEKTTVTEKFPVPFCGDVEIPHEIYKCNDCEEEGDFDNSLDKALTKAIDKKNTESAPHLMDLLSQQGITMTYLEKALRLPFRTSARWRRGRISHSSLALLRIIKFSPALLQAADDNFSEEAAKKYHINCTWNYFVKYTSNPHHMLIESRSGDLLFAGFAGSGPTTVATSTILGLAP